MSEHPNSQCMLLGHEREAPYEVDKRACTTWIFIPTFSDCSASRNNTEEVLLPRYRNTYHRHSALSCAKAAHLVFSFREQLHPNLRHIGQPGAEDLLLTSTSRSQQPILGQSLLQDRTRTWRAPLIGHQIQSSLRHTGPTSLLESNVRA